MSTIPTDDLDQLSDRDLGDRAEQAITAAAIMPYSTAHQAAVDAIHTECARRGRGIYQRAWNRAVRSQGHDSMVRPVTAGA